MSDGRLDALDRALILDLGARYAQALDLGHPDAFTACFTEDGRFEGIGGTLVGHDQLEQRVLEALERPTFRHLTSNVVIDEVAGRPDEARSSSYFIYYFLEPDGYRIQMSGRYEDDLVKVTGRWKFKRRRVILDEIKL